MMKCKAFEVRLSCLIEALSKHLFVETEENTGQLLYRPRSESGASRLSLHQYCCIIFGSCTAIWTLYCCQTV